MSFLSGLFGGSNPTLNANIATFGANAGAENQQGLSDTSSASGFWNSILSGGGKQALAPQIGSIMKQGEQQKQSLSQFGNRGGGNNAAMQDAGDKSAASVNDLVGSQMSGAASGLASLGSNMLNMGLQSGEAQDQASQQRMQNWQNSILGKGIGGAVGAAESFGLGSAGGALSSIMGGTNAGAGASRGGMMSLFG